MINSECPDCRDPQYYLVTDHNKHIKSENFHGSIEQFCAAFYHVPQGTDVQYDCLTDIHECKIHKEINEKAEGHGNPRNQWTPPKTVVALVKFEETTANGCSFARRYTNCYEGQRHAEQYFKLDVKELISDSTRNNIKKITMYITFQPCHKSVNTGGTLPNYSCCDILESLMKEDSNGLFNDVEIIIKSTHIYKANQKKKTIKSRSDCMLNIQIKNALEGMHKLMNVGIKFDRMNNDNWNYLRQQMVQDNEQFYPSDKRVALDNEIGTFLTTLGGGAGDSGTTSGGTDHSGTTSSATCHSGGGSSSSQSVPTRRPKEKARKTLEGKKSRKRKI